MLVGEEWDLIDVNKPIFFGIEFNLLGQHRAREPVRDSESQQRRVDYGL